jgi:hypothetical protein
MVRVQRDAACSAFSFAASILRGVDESCDQRGHAYFVALTKSQYDVQPSLTPDAEALKMPARRSPRCAGRC